MTRNALDRPISRRHRAADALLAVNRGGAGDWQFDLTDDVVWRLRCDRITAGINDDFPRAYLSVNPAPYTEAGETYFPAMRLGDLCSVLGADDRVCVYVNNDDGTRTYLFEGYPSVIDVQFSGLQPDAHQAASVVLTSLAERLNQHESAQIWGRWLVTRGTDGTDEVRHVESLPCVFNPDGRPNRHADLWTQDAWSLPVFTYDGDPAAVYWTYGDVLQYLILRYWKRALSDHPLIDGNGLDLTEDIVADNAGPATFSTPETPRWRALARSQATNLHVDGLGLIDALLLWCHLAGARMQQYTSGTDVPDSRLVFWAIGDGGPWTSDGSMRTDPDSSDLWPARSLELEQEGTAAEGRTAAELLRRNEITQGRILIDPGSIITGATAIGDVERYEVRVGGGGGANEFMPAWAPDTTFGDSLAGTPLDDKVVQIRGLAGLTERPSDAGLQAMWDRYVTVGLTHLDYTHVGRSWVLNESGEYAGATYGRINGLQSVWGASVYGTRFDWAAACGCPLAYDRAAGTRSVSWSEIRRRVLKPLTLGPGDAELRPIIEASVDGGTTWHVYPGTVRALDDQVGFYLPDQNLAAVHLAEGDEVSVWEAIVRGLFRLRATCTVEGDSRVVQRSGSLNTLSTQSRHALLELHSGARYEQRDAANSPLPSRPDYGGSNRDDTGAATSYANRFLAANGVQRVSTHFFVPWLSRDWLVGDRVTGIESRGVRFAQLSGSDERHPEIVRIEWHNTDAGQATRIDLEDQRANPRPT